MISCSKIEQKQLNTWVRFQSAELNRTISLPSDLARHLAEQAARSISDSYVVAQGLAGPQATAVIDAANADFLATHSTLQITSAALIGFLVVVVFIMLSDYRNNG